METKTRANLAVLKEVHSCTGISPVAVELSFSIKLF